MKTFKLKALLVCLCGDLLTYFQIQEILQSGQLISRLQSFYPPEILNLSELQGVLKSTLGIFLFVFFILNTLAYIFFWKEKKWGIGYVKTLAWLSTFYSLSFLPRLFSDFQWMDGFQLIIGLGYFWVAWNIRKLPPHPGDK